jgi:hypothetical protein
MRWDPQAGHVPRGFCGATGRLSEVDLVLITAEPGDPFADQNHADASIDSVVAFSVACLRDRRTPFHSNMREILDLCFPDVSFEEQLRRTWRTNSVLCSAEVEGGAVPRRVEETCIGEYLTRQLALIPQAVVAALGRKAQRRLARHGIPALPALHPSSRKSSAEKRASWKALAKKVHRHHMAMRHGKR